MARTEFDTDNEVIQWFAERYVLGDVTEGTVEKRVQQLDTFAQWYDGDLTVAEPSDIDDFFVSISDYAFTTLTSYKNALSTFYEELTVNGRIESNPMSPTPTQVQRAISDKNDTKKEKHSPDNDRVEHLEPEEVQKLVENVREPTVRNKLLIRLMAQTGVRPHEAAKITLDRLDRENRTIKIVSDKTGDSRKVVYQENLSPLIRLWLDGGYRDVFKSARDSDYLFVSRKKEKINGNTINKVVKDAAEEAGLQEVFYTDGAGGKRVKITAHSLRHTFAVIALRPDENGDSMDIGYIQRILGHDDITTTEDTYLDHIQVGSKRDMRRNGPTYVD